MRAPVGTPGRVASCGRDEKKRLGHRSFKLPQQTLAGSEFPRNLPGTGKCPDRIF